MRVMVFGAAGMLGHMLLRVLALDPRYEVFGTIRGAVDRYPQLAAYRARIFDHVDVADQSHVGRLVERVAPDAVINAVAVRAAGAGSASTADFVHANALWPHQIAAVTEGLGIRLCHISSDGVFSGQKGQYSEDDQPDPCDLYSAAKFVGEPAGKNVLTLRTSIIGPELNGSSGLLSWLLGQSGPIKGYSRWLYSGFTTLELAHIFRDHILCRDGLDGIYHIAADSISKFELLKLMADIYDHRIDIVEDSGIVKDRTLNADRFGKATGYHPPSWPEMISALRHFG